MNKILAALLGMTGMMAATAGAQTFESGSLCFKVIDGSPGTCEVTTAPEGEYAGSITIPEKVEYKGETYTVTGIGPYAFAQCPALEEVEIPSTVSYLGRNAFQSSGLKKISLPTSVVVIEEQTFYRCPYLKSVDAPGVTEIGASAFSRCSSLSDTNFSEDLAYIGDQAFLNCSQIDYFILYSGVTLGKGVFSECSGLRKITLPRGMSSLPESTFSSCISLKEVENSRYLSTIGDHAFDTCVSLETFEFSPTCREIGSNAFTFCSSLKVDEITGDGLTIGSFAFSSANGIMDLSFTGVAEIGEEAFTSLSFLRSLKFDETIHEIKERAFRHCDEIAYVECLAEQPPFMARNSFEETVYKTATLKVPCGKGLLYRQTPPWSYFLNVKETDDPTGVGAPENDGALSVGVENGELRIAGYEGEMTLWSASGAKVREAFVSGEGTFPLPSPGVYVVATDKGTVKVLSR